MASEGRNLLPRWPSDVVVLGLAVAGLGAALALGADPLAGLAPAALAALFQKVNGHVQAWRRGGVERAFAMESAAISFYVTFLGLVVVGALEATSVVRQVDVLWLAVGALFVDTIVRSWRESRFV